MCDPGSLSLHVTYDPFSDVLDGSLSDPDDVSFVEADRLWLFYDAGHDGCDQLAGFSLRAASTSEGAFTPKDIVGEDAWAECVALISSHRAAALDLSIDASALPWLRTRWAHLLKEYGPDSVGISR